MVCMDHLEKIIEKECCNDLSDKEVQLRDDIDKLIVDAGLSVPQVIKVLDNCMYGALMFSRVVGFKNID